MNAYPARRIKKNGFNHKRKISEHKPAAWDEVLYAAVANSAGLRKKDVEGI